MYRIKHDVMGGDILKNVDLNSTNKFRIQFSSPAGKTKLKVNVYIDVHQY